MNLPSRHVHVSLRTKDGRNLFAVDDSEKQNGRTNAQYEDTKWLSQEGEWFLAGVLDGLEDILPMVSHTLHTTLVKTLNQSQLVPTINGYKRLVAGEVLQARFYFCANEIYQSVWAPNAVTWGYDSRAASIRLITPPSCPRSATRMEIRVPGADMNPYFALSAIFLLGLRGIGKKMPIAYPPMKEVMNDKPKVAKLATSLERATALFMREGSVAREVFGDEFVEHFGGT